MKAYSKRNRMERMSTKNRRIKINIETLCQSKRLQQVVSAAPTCSMHRTVSCVSHVVCLDRMVIYTLSSSPKDIKILRVEVDVKILTVLFCRLHLRDLRKKKNDTIQTGVIFGNMFTRRKGAPVVTAISLVKGMEAHPKTTLYCIQNP